MSVLISRSTQYESCPTLPQKSAENLRRRQVHSLHPRPPLQLKQARFSPETPSRSRDREEFHNRKVASSPFAYGDTRSRVVLRNALMPSTPRPAFAGLKARGAVWTRPELRALIAYRGATAGGELRAASFKGLSETRNSPVAKRDPGERPLPRGAKGTRRHYVHLP